MLITLVDDSIPYNGTTPSYQPLGGAEKAFASLPAALARCGHVVRAITRAPHALSIDNVSWLNFDGRIPPITEVLIALRKPSLLETTRATNSRILWVPGPTGYLGRHEVLDLLERNDAKIVLQGITHVEKYDVESELSYRAITPGVREEYREAEEMQPATTPIAIVTTHPKQGLDWLLDLWCAKIEPQVKGAELHVYSAMFRNAEDGEPVADDVKPVWDKVVAAHEQGVRVKAPAGDNDMARHYRYASVHLYPGSEKEMYCSTLAESQAVGVPAVARPMGAVKERIIDEQTGFLAEDDDSFVKSAVKMLSDIEARDRVSELARRYGNVRSWDTAAREFETLFR
jgi:hypothetical protein